MKNITKNLITTIFILGFVLVGANSVFAYGLTVINNVPSHINVINPSNNYTHGGNITIANTLPNSNVLTNGGSITIGNTLPTSTSTLSNGGSIVIGGIIPLNPTPILGGGGGGGGHSSGGGYYPNQSGMNENVTTTQAINLTPTSARLGGNYFNQTGISAIGYFQYGTTNSLNLKTNDVNLGTGTSLNLADTAKNLTPATTYYFRAVALKQGVLYYGNILTFRTANAIIPNNYQNNSSDISNQSIDTVPSITNIPNTPNYYPLSDSNPGLTANSLFGFGAGFFPTTLFGWLLLLLVIVALVIISRKLYQSYKVKKIPPKINNQKNEMYTDNADHIDNLPM